MATSGHLWRTTRVNTRKNSTRASVAAVLRAERVRAAQSGAAAAGVAAAHALAPTAVPRAKRVVAFDESVTVHILPAEELRDAEIARFATEGYCVRCQAYIEPDQRKWKSAFGLGLLRQVDELESRHPVCRCEESRYPEYGPGGGQVVVYGDDDDEGEEEEGEDDEENQESEDEGDQKLAATPTAPLPIAMPTAPVPIALPVQPFTKQPLAEGHSSTPPPSANRERALRFSSRSRPRKKAVTQTATSPPCNEERLHPLSPRRSSVGSRHSSKSEAFFDAINRDSEEMRMPLPTRTSIDVPDSHSRVTGVIRNRQPPQRLDIDELAKFDDSEEQLRPVARYHSGRSPQADPLRISPSLSEIRRQMLDEIEADQDGKLSQISPARRNRTLPAPVVRQRTTPNRISSMSDADMEDRKVNVDILSGSFVGSDGVLARLGSGSSAASGYSMQLETGSRKLLSHLTPTNGSPVEGNSRGPSNTPSPRNVSRSDSTTEADHTAIVPEPAQGLAPSLFGQNRTSPTTKFVMNDVGGSSSGGLSASTQSMATKGEDELTQGRLRFRGRRARAKDAAATATVGTGANGSNANTTTSDVVIVAERSDTAPPMSPLVKQAYEDLASPPPSIRTYRSGGGRERSFAGFSTNHSHNLSSLSAQDTSVVSISATGLAERREEFSSRPLNGKKPYTRQVRTDLGFLGHLQAERKERDAPQRKLTGLRSLRERVSKLMRGHKDAPKRERSNADESAVAQPHAHATPQPHQPLAVKVGRQLCMAPVPEPY